MTLFCVGWDNSVKQPFCRLNKAIIDIRFRQCCAIQPPYSQPIGCVACVQKFPNTICACLAYWMILSAAWCYSQLNEPCCSECDTDVCSEDCQCFWMARTTPPKCLFFLGDLHLHLIHGSVAHPSLCPKWHVIQFSCCCTAHCRMCHYFTMVQYVSP